MLLTIREDILDFFVLIGDRKLIGTESLYKALLPFYVPILFS